MPKKYDLAGQTFNRLTVIRLASPVGNRRYWLCECACGRKTTIPTDRLVSGRTASCGCLQADTTRARSITHGQSKQRGWSRAYVAWVNVKTRCLNPNMPKFHRYGGRGIRICDRWLDFENFVADMGPRPPGASIDRIDNNGNYEPGNCRWATPAAQNRNRSDNINLTARGQTLCITEWERVSGNSRQTIRRRLGKGWPPDDAIFRPVGV